MLHEEVNRESMQLAAKVGKLTYEEIKKALEKLIAELKTDIHKAQHPVPTHGKQSLKERAIGTCPRCGGSVFEGKKNFYCGNRDCQFAMWKNDRFFESRKKALTKQIAAALLKDGKAKVKGMYSEKSGKTFDATVLLADTGEKYVNYRFEQKGAK